MFRELTVSLGLDVTKVWWDKRQVFGSLAAWVINKIAETSLVFDVQITIKL